jgi:hypothetical protein
VFANLFLGLVKYSKPSPQSPSRDTFPLNNTVEQSAQSTEDISVVIFPLLDSTGAINFDMPFNEEQFSRGITCSQLCGPGLTCVSKVQNLGAVFCTDFGRD